MSSEDEMRRVLIHARDQLAKALDETVTCKGNHYETKSFRLPHGTTVALAYGVGLFDLLATYLKIGDIPATNGHKPSTISPGDQPFEKVERNAAVVAARAAGETRKDVAARFGVSERRIDQIVAAHETRRVRGVTP